MCFPALLAAIPALASAAGAAGGAAAAGGAIAGTAAAASAGTFLGLSAATWGTIGSVVSAVGAIGSGIAGVQQSKTQEKIAKQNAALAGKASADALLRGSEEESRRRREAGQLYGEQVARLAANGIDISYGSPLKVIGDTKVIEEEDAGRILESSRREADGFRIQASNYQQEAANVRREGYLGLGQSVLSAATGFASSASRRARSNSPLTA